MTGGGWKWGKVMCLSWFWERKHWNFCLSASPIREQRGDKVKHHFCTNTKLHKLTASLSAPAVAAPHACQLQLHLQLDVLLGYFISLQQPDGESQRLTDARNHPAKGQFSCCRTLWQAQSTVGKVGLCAPRVRTCRDGFTETSRTRSKD